MSSRAHDRFCTCNMSFDAKPCYLFIHFPHKQSKVITFNSIRAACAYAEKYIIDHEGKDIMPDDDIDYEFDTIWTIGDGVIVWAAVEWMNTVCSILKDVSNNTDSDWPFMITKNHQMIIGLGTNLNDNQRQLCDRYGYSLEGEPGTPSTLVLYPPSYQPLSGL